MFVDFEDETQTKIVSIFSGPQDPELYPYQGVVEDDDQRYLDYINPPPNVLAIQSAKLQGFNQLAAAQKIALANRIGTLNDAIELEMATPEEIAELPIRQAQLLEWKRYAVYLGRVTSQAGWPPDVEWPVQPADGMDLTVSATAPEQM